MDDFKRRMLRRKGAKDIQAEDCIELLLDIVMGLPEGSEIKFIGILWTKKGEDGAWEANTEMSGMGYAEAIGMLEAVKQSTLEDWKA